MTYVKELCVLNTFVFYISVLYTIIKYRDYFKTLLSEVRNITEGDLKDGTYCSMVCPLFRKEYFGYLGFLLTPSNHGILSDKYLRIYGEPYVNDTCLLRIKDMIVVSVINLNNPKFGDEILLSIQTAFRILFTVCNGGYVLWVLYLMFIQ